MKIHGVSLVLNRGILRRHLHEESHCFRYLILLQPGCKVSFLWISPQPGLPFIRTAPFPIFPTAQYVMTRTCLARVSLPHVGGKSLRPCFKRTHSSSGELIVHCRFRYHSAAIDSSAPQLVRIIPSRQMFLETGSAEARGPARWACHAVARLVIVDGAEPI
jgi:hypothetical protein